MLFVNFKTYAQGTGERAVALAKICEEVSLDSNIPIIPLVQTVDLFQVAKSVKIPVFTQHVDWFPQGQFTGATNLEAVLEAGAQGTLLNHSESQIPQGTIRQVLKRIKAQAGEKVSVDFKTIICCRTMGQAERLAKLKPDFLAYEPPELIGGHLSVSQAEPQVIKKIVTKIPAISVIVGAGIKSGEDVRKSLEIGAVGVLVSSGVVLAPNQKEALLNLISGFQ